MIELRRSSGEQAAGSTLPYGRGHVLRDEIQDRVEHHGRRGKPVSCGPDRGARRASDRSILTLAVGSVLELRHLASRVLNLDREVGKRTAVGAEGVAIEPALRRAQPHQPVDCPRPRADALFRAVCRIAVEDGLFRMAWVGAVNPQTGVVEPAHSAGFEGLPGHIHITTTETPEGKVPPGAPCASAVTSCAPISPPIHGSCRGARTPWRAATVPRPLFRFSLGTRWWGVHPVWTSPVLRR